MKKTLLICTLISISLQYLTAQITVNKSHIITAGKMSIESYDNGTYPFASKGANQTWDYTMLVEDSRDTLHYGLPQWYPGYTNFAGATMTAIYNAYDSSYEYLRVDSSGYSSLGYCDIDDGFEDIQKYDFKILSFPSTYNTTFTNNLTIKGVSFPIETDPDGAGPMPYIDSVLYDATIKGTSLIDGYGTIKIPLGSYPAIRQNTENVFATQNRMMYTNGSWKTMPRNVFIGLGFNPNNDTFNDVTFWTNDANIGVPVLQYSYSGRETQAMGITWVQAKTQASDLAGIKKSTNMFAYPNPCHASFKVSLPGAGIVNLTIFDMNGRLLKSVMAGNGTSVDISDFESGMYILKYRDFRTGSILQTQKIIRN